MLFIHVMAKLIFQPFLQWHILLFSCTSTFLIINVVNSCADKYFCRNHNTFFSFFFLKTQINRKFDRTAFIWNKNLLECCLQQFVSLLKKSIYFLKKKRIDPKLLSILSTYQGYDVTQKYS